MYDIMDDKKVQEIKQAFFEYVEDKIFPVFITPNFFAKQILPNESLLLKKKIINDLIVSGILIKGNETWVIKNMEK
jgi:hypothetical protein